MGVFLHLRDKVFRVKDGVLPVPLDPDLMFLAQNATQSNIIQDIYRTQMERNRNRPVFGDDYDPDQPRDTKSGEWKKGAGRSYAKKGGQIAESNKAFYKGGQFLPSTEAPPGTYKISGKILGKGREMIEPGKWEKASTPLHRSIYATVSNWLQPGKNGGVELKPDIRDDTGDPITRETSMRPGVKGHVTTEKHTVGELIDRYNKGERWVEVKLPPDVKVLMGKPTYDAPEFKEDDHPRNKSGEFTSGGGSKAEAKAIPTEKRAPRRIANEYGSNEFENYRRSVEDVPIAWLKKLEGNALRHNIDWVYDLGKDIRDNGLKSPLIINVGKDSRTAKLGEGNHRLRAMSMMGFTHAPARVVVGNEWGKGLQQPEGMDKDIIPQSGKYFKEDAAPSDVFKSLKSTGDTAEFKEDDHPRDEGGKFTAGHRAGSKKQQEVPSVLGSPEPSPEPSSEPKSIPATEPPKGLPKSLTTELANQGYEFDHTNNPDDDFGRHVFEGRPGNTIEYGTKDWGEGRYWEHRDAQHERRYSGYGNLSLIGHLRRYEKGEVFDSKFSKQFGDKLFQSQAGFKPFIESDNSVAFKNMRGDQIFIYKDYDKATLEDATWKVYIDHGEGDKRQYNEGKGWEELNNTLDTLQDAHEEHRRSVEKVQKQIHQEIEDASQVILKKAHIPPNLFKIVDTDYEFMLNGEKHYAAGTHDSQTGMITLYSKRLPIPQVRGVLSHEVMHYKFQHALDEFNGELDEIMHDERNGSDSVIKPDGSVLEQYAQDYPVYAAMNELMSNKHQELQDSDGVTSYSREWWKEYLDGKAPLRNAIHETLAEIARLDETDESMLEVKKPWMDLYRKVNTLYRTQKTRQNQKFDQRRERIRWQSQEKIKDIPDPLQRPASPSRAQSQTPALHPAVTKLAQTLMEVLNLKAGDKEFKEEEHPRGGDPEHPGRFSAGEGGSKPNAQTETKSISEPKQEPAPARGKQNTLLKGAAKGSHSATISTRRPTHVNAVEGDEYRRVDLDAMKLDPENFEHDVGLFKNAEQYPNFKPGELDGTPDQQARTIIDHMKKNLRFLYEAAPEQIRTEGHKWYEGAHRLAQEDADKYELPLQSVVGAYAALSPQNLWDMNVHQAKVVMDTYFNKQHEPWDDKMTKVGEKIWLPDPKKPATTPKAAKNAAQKEALYKLIKGKQLADMDTPVKKAMWIRTYDQAHNARSFNALSPDGRVIGTYLTDKKKPATNAWHTTGSIANAIIALESGGDRDLISPAMGNQHKVRSFYNNILDPNSDNDDVTMDTHAVGAALLSPMGQSHTAVMHSLGSKPATAAVARKLHYVAPTGNSLTGMSGTYPLYAEANRELAAELTKEANARRKEGDPPIKIYPRVLQSITWEAKRRLFDRHLTKEAARDVYAAWHDYHDGKASLEDTQKKVVKLAGGFSKGQEGDDGNNKRVTDTDFTRRRSTGDSRELHPAELGFRTARTVDERGRGPVTGRVTSGARRLWQSARLTVFLH